MSQGAVAIAERLTALGLHLPPPVAPRFAYSAVVVHGGAAYVSGQLPWRDGVLVAPGRVGDDVSVASASEAARCCVLNGLAVLDQALGSLARIDRFLKVTGFVASAPSFHEQPQVIDAASLLLIELFGDAGRHARSAVGVAALPRDASVEIEFIVAVRQ